MMTEASRAFLVFVVVSTLHHFFCQADTAPQYYSFVQESISAPDPVSFYDYIIIGGGTAGCPLAATLSETAKVLVLERGGSPYVNTRLTDKVNFFLPLLDPSPDSNAQLFVSEDGVYNHRARVLGGGSVINAGFYSHAETAFIKETGLDEALVNDSYKWVEDKLVFRPPSVLQWESAVRDGLLEAGVLPYNGFTYDHIIGTKIGASIFDDNDHRHSAADLLHLYADPTNIKVYLHATVLNIIFITNDGSSNSRPRAGGVIFRDTLGVRHRALLRNDPKSEIILSAGAIGSPQLLMLSGIGPANQLEALGIEVVMDQPMVGQGMADNPMNILAIPSPRPVEVSLIPLVGISQFGIYVEAFSGLNLAPTWVQWLLDNLATFLNQTTAWSNIGDFFSTQIKGGVIVEKVNGPKSRGYLELKTTNPDDNPKVKFNYFEDPEDLSKCVQGVQTLIDIVNSEAFSTFRYQTLSTQDLLDLVAVLPLNLRPRHLNTATSLEQYCIDTVMTIWHYHGGCQVGKVVDGDYRVLGVDGLRVIDGSTFDFSPGTNPQATVMMLGRYMGVRIQQERHSSRQ